MGQAGIVFLPTSNLEAVRHFYGEKLGLELSLDQGPCLIFRLGGTGFVGFCLGDGPLTPPSGVIITIVTQEVDQWYDRLVAQGVTVDGHARANPSYKIYHFFARDPNGYRVEIQRFDDPNWRG